MLDLTGRRFGRLVAIRPTEERRRIAEALGIDWTTLV